MAKRVEFIGVDLDGVIYDWDRAARRALREHRNVDIDDSESTYWNEIKDIIPKEDWDWVWDTANDVLYGYDDLHHEGSIDALKRLGKRYELLVITARPYSFAPITAAWLRKIGVTPYGVFHTPHKHLVPITCKAYLEDRDENVVALADAHPNAQIFMPRRKWNVGAESHLLTYPNVTAFDDWEVVLNWLS